MGKFPVSRAKEDALIEKMATLSIHEDDLEERYSRGSGKGGQKVNKTSSAVLLLHKKSGYSVRVESSRSQALNRFKAREALCAILEAELKRKKQSKAAETSKLRRQNAKRSKRTKATLVQTKRRQGEKKVNRRKLRGSDD